MRIAYILDSFPNTTETFISDEIHGVITSGRIACDVYVLKRPDVNTVNTRAQFVLNECAISYHVNRSIFRDLIDFAIISILRPRASTSSIFQLFVSKNQRWLARKSIQISRAVLERKTTHIHAHFADQAAEVAMWVSRFTGVPFTFTTHGYDIFFEPPDNFPELAVHAKSVICVSHFNKAYVSSHFGVSESKLVVIRCGIYLADFPFAQSLHRKNSSLETTRILAIGRLVPEKGQRYLLDAVASLVSKQVSIRLVIVGDGPLAEELNNHAASLGIATSVDFVGARSSAQVRQHLREADIFVMPSISESMGVATMEAMASGVPAIATSVRGVPELVEHGVSGLLCPPSDAQALAESIALIVRNPELADRIRVEARSKIDRYFNRDLCTIELIKMWRESSTL